MDRGQEGLSVFELIKVMIGYKRNSKIRFLSVFVGVALICLLAILLWYNKSREVYVTQFNYLIETFDGNTYYDGTKFIYLDLVSEESLNKIKNSNPEFSNIDVNAILSENDITIERNTDESIYAFTLTIKKKYFNSSNQAKAFVGAIANIPLDTTNEMLKQIDYTNALYSYTNYDMTYEDKINDLISQATLINNFYANIITKYGDRLLDSNFSLNTISSLQKKAIKTIENLNLSSLSEELNTHNYVYDYETTLPLLEIKKADAENQLSIVENKITAVKQEIDRQLDKSSGASAMVEGLNTTLAGLLVQKEELNSRIKKYQDKIDYGQTTDTTVFDQKLSKSYDTLAELTQEITNLHKSVLTTNQKVYFDSNNVVTKTGGVSIVVTIGLSLVLGLGIAMLTNLVMDLAKYKRMVLLGNTTSLSEDSKEEKKED